MSTLTDRQLSALQQALHYQFADLQLLKLALTHRSASKVHNQRLEFLGDAALGLAMADLLFQFYPDAPEGELSQLRAAMVNRSTLAEIARALDLGAALILGLGEQKSGGRQRDSILSDALEAVLGAVYIDGGFTACQTTIQQIFSARLNHHTDATTIESKDAKTRLQEIMQAQAVNLPAYEVVDIKGDEHNQQFFVRCRIALSDRPFNGTGRSRREAEQQAASAALAELARVRRI